MKTWEALARSIKPSDIEVLAGSQGWREVDRDERFAIFTLEDEQLLVPSGAGFDDYGQRVLEIAERMVGDQYACELDVLAALATVDADVVRLVYTHGPAWTPLDLRQEATLLKGIQEALLAAACSVLRPAPFHKSVNLEKAQQLVRSNQVLRANQREDSVCIASPSPGSATTASYSRHTLENLVSALTAITTSEMESGGHAIYAEENAISANLCNALHRMRPRSRWASLLIDVRWSLRMASERHGEHSTLRIESEHFLRLPKLAEELKTIQPTGPQRFTGRVATLDGRVLRGQPAGHAVLEITFAGNKARVHTYLDADQYAIAVSAHATGRRIRFSGLLTQTGRRYEFHSIEGVELAGE